VSFYQQNPEMEANDLALRQIAGRLNAEGHTTRRAKEWNAIQVKRALRLRICRN
jgi:hypothetical protein